MEIFNYCNQCKKSLNCNNFDKKKNGSYYTRCKVCRKKHNDNEKKKYKKKTLKFNKSFASYDGQTAKNNLKINCWLIEKNNNLKPRDVSKQSNKKYWFKCDVCNHDFNSSLANISRLNRWCPYCANQKLCNDNDCKYCFNKSFASYNEKTEKNNLKIDCWLIKKNNDLKPRDVFKKSNKKYWFKCDVCNHDFNSLLKSISRLNSWCPYCANQKLCNDTNCKHCFNKSFASYNEKTAKNNLKINCWLIKKNNDLKPRDVSISSGKKCWFKCDVCNHDFNSSLNNISRLNSWCPYCAVQKLCSDTDCEHCFKNSFASYNKKTAKNNLKIDCWLIEKNNNLKPRDVSKHSDKKYWFKCDVCNHDFNSSLASISGLNTWCPNCKNKTELKLYNWLLKQLIIKEVKREYKPEWCSTKFRYINKNKKIKNSKYQYRYDFLITFKNNNKLIIELDGIQHFKQVSNWKTPLHNQIRDKYKEFLANKHKIPLIRCIQEDVFMNRNNWKKKLKKKLKKYNLHKLNL